ncbi:hypothetical protein PV326_005394 [Microctonus aethiopoides]|nr:hypothetical protein PV326_005394 [Microctonus aethiopoides]
MTELQPSPSGYRGQDEAPSLSTCSLNTFVKAYPNHSHPVETSNYKGVESYSQDNVYLHHQHQQQQQQQHHHHHHHHHHHNQNNNKHQQQTTSRGSSPGEHYRKKTDRRTASENDNNNVGDNGEKKSSTIAGYNEGYKKNTPGYKNDSGYSESIGFDSFSLPLNERDEASPPPTPPVRDASSLKGVCYGPGHEKYPSWPSVTERHSDDDINSIGHSGSHRSKSWTDQTNYPKEKPAQYTRPLAKRPNAAFTQQLKTVMERCEKIPAETFESRGSRSSLEDDQPRLWPRVDREGKSLGDAEYVVPSPPEREQQQPSQTLSHADLEAYVRSYQDPQVTQVDIYRETTLTQAGLEEYTRVQHSQQASYAQSEGYHSYVSSVDSTTNTPFLDRLRRDSEAVSQRPEPSWEETSREGRDSVVTTSSGGSASSSETLKWHGSMSDVSVSSGLPPRQVNNDTWPHGSMSDVSSVNGIMGIQKTDNNDEKWQGSINNVNSSMINHSSIVKHRHNNDNKWQDNKWQITMNDRNCKLINSRTSLPGVISHCASVNDVCQAITGRETKWQESSIDDESVHERTKGIQRGWESCLNVDQARYNHNSRLTLHSPTSHSQQQLKQNNIPDADEWNTLHGSMSDVSQANISIHGNSKQLIAHSARVQTPQRHHSESVLYLDRERNQRKLYPISTTQPQETGQSTRISPVSPQQGHLSVADRISELEKQQQQQMRYTYLDPDKRHRVSDPTLKAIQKKALLSFYERHHQSSWRSEPQLTQDTSPTTQSPPPQPPPRPRPSSSRRASSASDYASGSWRDKTNKPHNNELPSPKHQHSNSCGSLSTDLLGPVIVGPAISIDDWVPERPPKKPHLRAVYNDRVPSPDLPPPSPPTVTENEVLNCDDPLPPPPPPITDLNERNLDTSKDYGQHEDTKRHCRSQQIERSSTRRSKHNKRANKSSSVSSPTENNTKSHVNENNFIRGATLKSAESEHLNENNIAPGYATHRMITTGRSSLRYPSTDKLMVNGRVSSTRRIPNERNMSRPPARLPDLVSQRYSDSGNQRPAPQVPVESRIIRQESMRVESTRMDVSGLLNSENDRLEHCLGQRPQPQVPKNNGIDKTITPYLSSPIQQTSRPNYLALSDSTKSSTKYSENIGYPVNTPVKTSYEANAKLLAESNPQKYHEPPKYGSNHHQKNYYVLPPKYMDVPKQQMSQSQYSDRYPVSPGSPPPPPLAPRQKTPGRKSLPVPPRPAPPQQLLQGVQLEVSAITHDDKCDDEVERCKKSYQLKN